MTQGILRLMIESPHDPRYRLSGFCILGRAGFVSLRGGVLEGRTAGLGHSKRAA